MKTECHVQETDAGGGGVSISLCKEFLLLNRIYDNDDF